jgi:RES domain-containing protein
MIIYRIQKKKYIRDLSGYGAYKFGQRWNFPGTAVLYTAQSVALCMLECLVHIGTVEDISSEEYQVISIELPKDTVIETVEISDLPSNWNSYPSPTELKVIGTEWAKKSNNLALRVPSVVVPIEFNYILNPRHKDYRKIIVSEPIDISFDNRLFHKS